MAQSDQDREPPGKRGNLTHLHAIWLAETGQSLHTNDPSQPTYTGKSTFWAGANLNSQNNFTATVTFSFHAKGSDGSRITGHGVANVTLHADGTVTVEFDKVPAELPVAASPIPWGEGPWRPSPR